MLGGSGELDAPIAMSDRMSHGMSVGWGIGGNGHTVYAMSTTGTKIVGSNFTARTTVVLDILGMKTLLDLSGGWPVGPMAYFVNRGGYLRAFDLES